MKFEDVVDLISGPNISSPLHILSCKDSSPSHKRYNVILRHLSLGFTLQLALANELLTHLIQQGLEMCLGMGLALLLSSPKEYALAGLLV